MVFATLAAQGVKDAEDCPALAEDNKRLLRLYLDRFQFDL
jgi:hypothetical protein